MRKSHFTLVPERGAGSAELTIGLRSAPCLADHRIHGMVVPGSFYIAAAAVLHREVFDAPAEIFENVQFEIPTGKVRRGTTAPQTTGPGPVPSAARLLTCPPPPSFAPAPYVSGGPRRLATCGPSSRSLQIDRLAGPRGTPGSRSPPLSRRVARRQAAELICRSPLDTSAARR